jgi:hypothetical protein
VTKWAVFSTFPSNSEVKNGGAIPPTSYVLNARTKIYFINRNKENDGNNSSF